MPHAGLTLWTVALAVCCLADWAHGQSHMRRAGEGCASYTPTICAIHNVNVERKHCHPYPCNFDVDHFFYCPLVAGGYFSYATGGEGGGCKDPFMSQAHHLPPPCGARCCRADHAGEFAIELEEEEDSASSAFGPDAPRPHAGIADSANFGEGQAEEHADDAADAQEEFPEPVRRSFQPTDSTCRYRELGRGQLMRFLATHNSSLLVVGDSTMRQAFLRLVAMMRGQSRQLDFHVHTHAQYQVCREVDFLRIAANNPAGDSSTLNAQFLKDIVPAFFHMEVGPGQVDAKRVLTECGRPPVQINYLQAPLWDSQLAMLPRYISGLEEGHKPVVVISVGFWQSGEQVPASYLAALSALRHQVTRLFFVGVPVARVASGDHRLRLEARNAVLRGWAEREGRPFTFVDFEALAGAANAPPGTRGTKHFSCWVDWMSAQFPLGAAGNPAGGGQLLGRLERVHATEDGACADEMNRNLWQIIVNSMLDSTGAQQMEGT